LYSGVAMSTPSALTNARRIPATAGGAGSVSRSSSNGGTWARSSQTLPLHPLEAPPRPRPAARG
jgi:hypothetical protein